MVTLARSGSVGRIGWFYRIVSCRGNCRGGSRAQTSSDRLASRTARGRAPLAAHPHLALQASRRGPVAQGIEQQPSKLKVAGSNPAGVANKFKDLLQFPRAPYVAYVAAFFRLF